MRDSQIAFQPSWGRRIVGMEGLRALAAIGVLIGHTRVHMSDFVSWGVAAPLMYPLLNGLTLFFALSGFLLFRPFASALLTGDKFPAIGRYATNRALRVFPAYIVITLLVSLVLGTAYVTPQLDSVESSGELIGYMTDPGLLLINMTMLQTLFPFSLKTGISVAWSLTVELVFYVVMPLMAIVAWNIRKRTKDHQGLLIAAVPIAGMFLIGLAGKIVKWSIFQGFTEDERFLYEWGGNWLAVFARSFPAHADLFAFGMLAALLVAAFEAERIPHAYAARFRAAAFAAAIAMVGASYFTPGDFKDTTLAVGFGAALLFVALPARTGGPGIVAKSLDFLPLRYVGLVSYSLYLWHVPVIWLVVKLGWQGPDTYPGFFWNLGLVFAISLAFSSVTYHLIEKPALALKKRTDKRKQAQPEQPQAKVSRTSETKEVSEQGVQ
ncbi:acyltransferase family protein [Microbacterium sp.]|uniref:acyltransferase family protein n=1 Tax=Microbacterium sp. TaxID=51671 RepID=UPI003C2573B2